MLEGLFMKGNIKIFIFLTIIFSLVISSTIYGVSAASKGGSTQNVNGSERLKTVKNYLKSGYSLQNIYTAIVLAGKYNSDIKPVLARHRKVNNWRTIELELKKKVKTKAKVSEQRKNAKSKRAEREQNLQQIQSQRSAQKYKKANDLLKQGYLSEDVTIAYDIALNGLGNDKYTRELLDMRVQFGENWNVIRTNLGIQIDSQQKNMLQPSTFQSDASALPTNPLSDPLKELEWKYNAPVSKLESLKNKGKTIDEIEIQLFEEKVAFYNKNAVSRQELEEANYYSDMYQESLDRVVYFWKKYRDWYSVAWALYAQG